MGSVTIIRIMAGFALAGFFIGLSAAIVSPAFSAMLAMFFSVGYVLWGAGDVPDEACMQAINSATERKQWEDDPE